MSTTRKSPSGVESQAIPAGVNIGDVPTWDGLEYIPGSGGGGSQGPQGAQGAQGAQGSQGTQGATGPTAGPLTREFYVDQNAAAGGTGAEWKPFNTLAAAIAAAPLRSVGAATIYLSPGDYTAEGPIAYTDKRLSIQGSELLNASPDPPTSGVYLHPTSSDDSNLLVEIIRTNSNITPQSQGIIVMMQDAHCEAIGDGVHFGTWLMVGSSPLTNIVGSENSNHSTLQGNNYGTNGMNVANLLMDGGIFYNNPYVSQVGYGLITNSEVRAPMAVSTLLELYNCTFPGGTDVILTGSIRTDLATYSRGVAAGVTWPDTVEFVDLTVQLQPVFVASGVGSNSLGDPTPAYGSNLAGDLFICRVNGIGGTAPSLPGGWTKQKEQSGGGVISQVWTRDTRSSGGESGTITVTGGGAFPTQAQIDTFRYVATSGFIEDISGASDTGAGPTTTAAPTVVAGGAGRVAVCASFSNGGTPPSATAATGQTGGTWISRSEFDSGSGADMFLQTATLPTLGTITGGTFSMPGTKINTIGFALIGDVT